MSFRKSIRWRLQSWHGLLLAAMTFGFGMTVYRLERTNALRNADQELRIRLGVLTNTLDQGGKRGPVGGRPDDPPPDERRGEEREGSPPRRNGGPPGLDAPAVSGVFGTAGDDSFYYVIWSRNGGIIAKSDGRITEVHRPERGTSGGLDPATREHERWRECFIFTPPGECLLVGRSTDVVDREMREFGLKTTGVGALLLASGLGVGWWISTRALRPIARISAAAARIAEGHLKERIQTEETESELGKLAALLDNTFQHLDAAFDEQARFTSDAAHELRTPVSIILAQTQLALSRERSAEAYKDTIIMARRAALRMQGLTESLLQLAALDAGARVEFAPCDLSEIAEEQTGLLKALAVGRDISFQTELEPAHCMADAGQIGQVVLNLLSNAVKFSETGTTVTIRTRVISGWATFEVEDEGPGIASEHIPHLFERFYRAEASRNRETGGAGLGLAICKRIADSHAARLTVRSERGKGSVFSLKLKTALWRESPIDSFDSGSRQTTEPHQGRDSVAVRDIRSL